VQDVTESSGTTRAYLPLRNAGTQAMTAKMRLMDQGIVTRYGARIRENPEPPAPEAITEKEEHHGRDATGGSMSK
jgi:hypothetical protein